MEEGDRVKIFSEKKEMDPENLNVIEWGVVDQELARLCSLSSALNETKEKKRSLQRKLESLIQVEAESLSRLNELEEMHEKLEARKMVMVNLSMQYVIVAEKAKEHEKELNVQVRSLLVDGAALSVARKRLQETNDVFPGGKEYIRLPNLQKMLRMRQQYMVSQLSLLYPVKISAGPKQEQELESFPSSSKSGNFAGSKPVNPGSLTILGLHLTMLPFKTMSLFTDKKEAQKSSSALGYVAHAVSLIALYLKVPLRYPVHLGGSRSHIIDYAPSIEPSPSDMSSNTSQSTKLKHMEFPLYLDGQDTTRAAYAVFLLNKHVHMGVATLVVFLLTQIFMSF
ncbi:UV radiation resistance-associated gene protein isoform X2 [Morus notabilis]|uniref:UV radiation resistance-associated gene protein isoform X2 n=1 Tax=Morus notabilis TaxID=981085 RepID=UPI000CED0398|nr:UV radiation resistance-associated gene protein isoform X2 [Morus notabilis]